MVVAPSIPKWIRDFRHDGWLNIFELVPTTNHLYATETLYGNWDSRVLLLAKDACPADCIRKALEKGDSQPWRHSKRGEGVGARTNERLCRFVSLIPEIEPLYGSATANMLYDDPRTSRALGRFYSGNLQIFLQQVLSWVLKSMPGVEWIGCLGQEAWFLTCSVFDNSAAANNFKHFRERLQPITGTAGKKTVGAFPLHHPSRVANKVAENEWQAFGERLRNGVVAI
jgi:hypothetical protein